MKTIIGILAFTTGHIDIYEHRSYIKISTLIEVKESDVHEMINAIEEMGGEWKVRYNSDGDIRMRVTFKTSVDSSAVKAAKLVNRHWFESRFIDRCNRGELLKYCEDILTASK